MTAIYPITDPLGNEADTIIAALKTRTEQIKIDVDSQSLLKRISLTSMKIFGLACAMTAAASVPVAAFVTLTAPAIIGVTALISAIACLALSIHFDPRSTSEMIVKDLWKGVFEALREGNGAKIIATAQELAKQKEKRAAAFNESLGGMDPTSTTPFLHKTCFVGYLQMALGNLRNGEDDIAKANAHLALSHFDSSAFPAEIERFARSIIDTPQKIRAVMEACDAGTDIHALDYIISVYLHCTKKA